MVAQWLQGERESGSVVDQSSDRADLGLTLGGVVSCVGGGAAGFSLSLLSSPPLLGLITDQILSNLSVTTRALPRQRERRQL